MKKLFALSFAAVILSSAALAQTERSVDDKPRTERHKGKHDKDKMMKELNLSKEQKAQLKTQHQDMKAKREALKAQDNITVKEMREKQAALKAEQKSNMNAVLTSEQRTKMEELKKQKMAEKGNKKMNKSKK
ncbi:MAG: hypothetical protein LH615_11230 [Ferruginibacter sp.]|nr:hypothetical protein [Ferruginibacter sp.]